MAILRPLNEFTSESVVLALEPARECVCHCSYCFANLNSKIQYKDRKKDLRDTSTFEFTLTKAYSSSYDPTDFLQWAVRNRMVLGYANTVEPFQDINQSIGVLKSCDKYSLPLFVQTKGLNFFDVWPYFKPFHDNAALFLSFPTTDDQALRRFEVGCPLSEHRWKVLDMAVAAGFYVILALSPYSEEWCDDPESFIREAHSRGIGSVFHDRPHLNIRQRKVITDKVMSSLCHTTEHVSWPKKALDHYNIIYDTCLELDLPIFANGWMPLHYGWPNTLASISPHGIYKRGLQWPYHDGELHYNLNITFDDQEFWDNFDEDSYDGNDSIVVTWKDALSIMESPWSCTQEFSWSSLADLISIKNIPPTWQKHLRPAALISEYYRALWNNPGSRQYGWRNPFSRIAYRPDGAPWTDSDGNLIMLYDPYFEVMGPKERTVDSLDDFRTLEPETELTNG